MYYKRKVAKIILIIIHCAFKTLFYYDLLLLHLNITCITSLIDKLIFHQFLVANDFIKIRNATLKFFNIMVKFKVALYASKIRITQTLTLTQYLYMKNITDKIIELIASLQGIQFV